ncbi:integral membrane protein mpv17 pmp22 family [Sporothrix brasiliensis 5110]|uniref:Integral membrane protein mpv17 pmp22 family n=1 Tax=Sporothrix brasiliensis 5110 TaxID=1398154 RepID=A0A0C2IZT4_9PEZI|nr:integral membrane protein mpv17 pmp22 family [Sporothrix brasiliensis 5110]KIH94611.1 integral membrane protein mpv17 pmp22 family [Sporothrix brasiliensis 5110]
MATPPLLPITIQAVVMSVVSSLIAQLLAAYQNKTPLASAFDVEAIIKFVVFAFVMTPPNVLWQTFLESSLPGSRKAPASNDKSDKLPKESLNIKNTIAKTLLDQSLGSSVNTFLFCSFMAAWDVLVTQGQFSATATAPATAASLVGTAVVNRVRTDFVPFMKAGWRFWPWVSLGNFALVPDVATRNLVGGLAGIVWGVYVNLFAAGSPPALKEE